MSELTLPGLASLRQRASIAVAAQSNVSLRPDQVIALVECAEAAAHYYTQYAVDEAEDPVICLPGQHEDAKRLRDAVTKLESLK